MITLSTPLPVGISPVPAGKIANVVTCLEMHERPPPRPVPPPPAGVTLTRIERPAPEAYRSWFRLVGADWLWASRLARDDAALRAILDDPEVELFLLRDGTEPIGLLELDFRVAGEGELVFFGLAAAAIGRGLGRFLMEAALAQAWSRPIRRFWVHTCTFDSQAAVAFYCRSGFRPYAQFVEVDDDPRLTGLLPRSAAPHVPLIEPDRPLS